MPSGAQNRAARTDRERREDDARALVPLRLSNLDATEQIELRAGLAALLGGEIGDPDAE
jgi:hypothetical protein